MEPVGEGERGRGRRGGRGGGGGGKGKGKAFPHVRHPAAGQVEQGRQAAAMRGRGRAGRATGRINGGGGGERAATVCVSAPPVPPVGHTPYSWGLSSSTGSHPFVPHRMLGHTAYSWQGGSKAVLSLRATAKAFVPQGRGTRRRGRGGGRGGGGGGMFEPTFPPVPPPPPAVPRVTITKSSMQDWRVAENEERQRRPQRVRVREEEERRLPLATVVATVKKKKKEEEEEEAFPSLVTNARTPTAVRPSQGTAMSYAARLLDTGLTPPLPPSIPPPSSQPAQAAHHPAALEQPFCLVKLDPISISPVTAAAPTQEPLPQDTTCTTTTTTSEASSSSSSSSSAAAAAAAAAAASSASSSDSSFSGLHPTLAAHALASKRFARRMKGKVQEQYTRRAQAAKREALETRLMCLEDQRARAIRRLEGGEEEVEEEEEEELQQPKPSSSLPAPSSSTLVENGGGGGWFTFLRPSSTVRGGLLVKERQEEDGEEAAGAKTGRRRRRHTKEDEFNLMLGVLTDPSSTWQSMWALMEVEGLDWDARDPTTRQNALHVAAAQGQAELLEALLRRVPSLASALESVDRRRMTPLLHAASGEGHGAGECLKLLLKRGANAEGKDRASETALHKAARAGNVGVVAMLIAHGGGGKKMGGWLRAVGVRNKRRETPLHLAAEAGWEEVVVLLLGHGADLWATDCDGHTPLSLASANGHVSVVALLLLRAGGSSSVLATEEGGGGREGGEDGGTGDQPQEKRRSPLIEAAGRGEDGVVALLLSEGWNPRLALEWRGRTETPLIRAIEAGHVSTVRLLIAAGAAWSLGKMEEALVFAAKSGEQAVLRWLMAEAGLVGEGKQNKDREENDNLTREEASKVKADKDEFADVDDKKKKEKNPSDTATKPSSTTTLIQPLTSSAKEALLSSLLEAAVLGGDTDTIVEVIVAGGKVEDRFLQGGGRATALGKGVWKSKHDSFFSLIYTPTLRNDMKALLSLPEEKEMHDVVFLVDGRRFPAHRAVLAARSEKFEAMFRSGGFAEGDVNSSTTATVVSLEGQWTGDCFANLLRYVYTGKGPPFPVHVENEEAMAELLLLADECLCFGLRGACEHLLGMKLESKVEDDTALTSLETALGLVATLDLQVLKIYCCRMTTNTQRWSREARQMFLEVLGHTLTEEDEEKEEEGAEGIVARHLLEASPLLPEGIASWWVSEVSKQKQDKDDFAPLLPKSLHSQAVTWDDVDHVLAGCPWHNAPTGRRRLRLTITEERLVQRAWQQWWREQPKGTALAPPGEALRLDLARLVGDGGLLPDCFVACGDDDELQGCRRETYAAHRALLMQRSERMAAHFRFLDSAARRNGSSSSSSSASVDNGGLPTYSFPSLSARTLRPLLSYLYTDRLQSVWSSDFSSTSGGGGHWDTETLMELAVTADEFLLPNLLALCEWELCQEEHLQGEGERGLEKTTQLFFLAEVVPAMAILRARSASVLVTRFHELPIGGVEGEGGIERKAVLKAALDCLIDL